MDGRVGGKQVGEIVGGQTMIRIYYDKYVYRIIFS